MIVWSQVLYTFQIALNSLFTTSYISALVGEEMLQRVLFCAGFILNDDNKFTVWPPPF
jgi:hypothetical protein